MTAYLSQSRHELDLPDRRALAEGDIYDRLIAGEELHKLGGLRTLYLATNVDACFINGERIPIPPMPLAWRVGYVIAPSSTPQVGEPSWKIPCYWPG